MHENHLSNKFCSECGQKLMSSSVKLPSQSIFDKKVDIVKRYLPGGITDRKLFQRTNIEGERKQVTVMFCDMVKFTPMVHKIGPEKAYIKMDQVYEILIRCVSNYEGTVNEMTGDGIMALFGAPIALEDAPQKALCSALAIHSEIAKFNSNDMDEIPIKMRIGIHTGPVIVGRLGNHLRLDFKAVGDTVNLAARLEELAETGTTYVSKDIYKLTNNLFGFESLGKKVVKGKKKKISLYKLLSMKKGVYRPRPGSERMIYSKMVGRDKELNTLKTQIMKTINGKGSIVSIIGEPGIGKSRLVAELKKREEMKRVTLIEGRAISIGRNLSFHPIIDLLKQWAKIREDDSEVTAIAKLEIAIRNVCQEEMLEVLPFIATLMGMKLLGKYRERIDGIEGEALEKLILKNVRELLIKATELTPLVIVTEDLQWADTSSIDLMESLFRLAETHSILFINVFRPGYKETGDRIVKTIKGKPPVYYVEIILEALNEQMSEAIIANVLNASGIHHAVLKQIVGRSGGNPFFIEEVVRSFIDEGAVVLKDGTFEVTEKIHTVAIPYTINEVLMSRIDRLDEKTRDLVKIASVIGRNFFYRILLDVAISIEDIDDRLSYLTEIQLISVRKRIGEIEYIFKHALAQEAVYESILHQKCKELHLKVAESIETIFNNKLYEFYGMLAYHYSKGENEEKTENYLIKAGEEALKASASTEALHYYQQALNLYLKKYDDDADYEKIAMLLKNIALAFFNKGQYVNAVECFDRALKCYGEESPQHFFSVLLKFIYSFSIFIISLYFPYFKFKNAPSEKDKEIIMLCLNKVKALGVMNPRRFFIESIYTAKRMANYDLTKIDNGAAYYAGTSVVISWAGISFRLSRKILEFCKIRVHQDDIKSMLFYKMCELAYNCVASNYEVECWDGHLIDQNLRIGEIYPSVLYCFHHGNKFLETGRYKDVQRMIAKLSEISDVYDNDFSRTVTYELKVKMLMKYRRINEALIEVKSGIDFATKLGMSLFVHEFYSIMARLQILLKDDQGAKESLMQAKEYLSEAKQMPYYHSNFLLSNFLFDIYQIEESNLAGDKREINKRCKNASRSGKKMLKNARKVACDLTEALKLMGIYFWTIDRQKKALMYWNKSIKEGERLGAHLELSRTYFEIGKRLSESKSKYNELQGIKTKEFLKMARSLFEKLSLHRDLYEFDRIFEDRLSQ